MCRRDRAFSGNIQAAGAWKNPNLGASTVQNPGPCLTNHARGAPEGVDCDIAHVVKLIDELDFSLLSKLTETVSYSFVSLP